MRYNFTDQSTIDCGGTLKEVTELSVGDTMLSYDVSVEDWAMTTVSSINYSILESTDPPTNCIKINSLPTSLHAESLIIVKDDNDNILYGYFTEEPPTNTTVDSTKLVKVIAGTHKFFNGGSWVSISDITYILGEWRYSQVVLGDYHTLMVDNILVSTL